MDIAEWLEELGLSRYQETLAEFPIADIVEFTDDDLRELGVLTPHRKKLLAAISAVRDEDTIRTIPSPSDQSVHNLYLLINTFPHIIATPLNEYKEENHPGMKLWAACDAIELLLRFFVTISVSDRRRNGELDDKLLKQLWGKIEMPTLGAWMAMARSLAQAKSKGNLVVPEIDAFVWGALSDLLYGPDNPGTADTSFLALRNRLAHGGGLTRKEAERLLDIWQEPFEKTIESLVWLSEVRIIGLDERLPVELRGTLDKLTYANDLDVSRFEGESDGVWLIRDEDTVSLWPMALFGHPSVSTTKGNINSSDENATQIYMRKDVLRLQFTPLGVDRFSHSEAGETALEAFQSLFSLDRANRHETEKTFKIQDFLKEIQREANQMVGRHEEQRHIENSFRDLDHGVVWLSGQAGIGKSFLVARMARDLMDKHQDSNTIVLAYRFKSGDDTRCNRDAFVNFVIERLVARDGFLTQNASRISENKAEDRLKSCLNCLSQDKKVIIILDGLDELLARDETFAEEVPLAQMYPRTIWVCAGRPKDSLERAFRINQAIIPYPHGLPPMRTRDIRGILLERIGLFRNRLLAGDNEKGDEIVNPFIELVAKRADGLPLYVNYVTKDIQEGNYPLDSSANLPKGLTAYHEKLINELGLGALKELLTPLAATLAVANEPLAIHEIATFLSLRDRIPKGEHGNKLITEGLSAISTMLRQAPDPEGEEGFKLYHHSLREHILSTETMAFPVQQAREAFAKAATRPDSEPLVANYLWRAGIDHLLDANKIDEARGQLLDLNHLGKMFELGKENLAILQYWLKIGDDNPGTDYEASVRAFIKNDKNEEKLKTVRQLVELCGSAGWFLSEAEIAKISLETHVQVLGENDEETLECLNVFGDALEHAGRHQEAELIHQQNYDARCSILGSEHTSTLISLTNIAHGLSRKGDVDAAEPLYRRVLDTRERTQGADHPDTLNAVSYLAIFLDEERGNKDAAEPLYRRVLDTRERTQGADHPATLNAVGNLGFFLKECGDLDAAEPLYRRVLDTRERTQGPDHPDTLEAVSTLATFLGQKRQEVDAAISLYHRVLETREVSLGPTHPETLRTMQNFAVFLREIGHSNEAIAYLEKILVIRRKNAGSEQVDEDQLASILTALGTTQSESGDYKQALTNLSESAELRRELIFKGRGGLRKRLSNTLNRLAVVYDALDNEEAAKSAREEANGLMLEGDD